MSSTFVKMKKEILKYVLLKSLYLCLSQCSQGRGEGRGLAASEVPSHWSEHFPLYQKSVVDQSVNNQIIFLFD